MRNKHIDLSGIYDSCYSGYDDYTAMITLGWVADSRTWQNDSVKFYNSDYGWHTKKIAVGGITATIL